MLQGRTEKIVTRSSRKANTQPVGDFGGDEPVLRRQR
jgi:hypothetical protein